MTDRPNASPWLRLLGGLIVSACFALSPQVFGQEATDEDEADEGVEEITVTGSRLRRDTYSSIAPLQVITGQVSREIGLIDPNQILQESTAASGLQIDLTFQGFVLDNGPGATQIDLRGLGAARTLLLINGRRVAAAGVEGAPATPDTQLIPGSLVQQYEVLLDGASSVYGSDAVAGVVNVILRKDFDGLELEGFSSVPAGDFSAGKQHTLSAAWGHNFDRGFVGVGAEYRKVDPVTLADRPWTNQCNRHYEVDQYGEIRTEGLFDFVNYNERPSPCKISGVAGRWRDEDGFNFGNIFYTPGFTNIGIPDFSDDSVYGVPVSEGPDGYNTVSWVDYSINGNDLFTHVIPDIENISAMAYGEYTFAGEANLTPYFEATYAERDLFIDSGAFQLFPFVAPDNPYSPCNPDGIDGVDCGLAFDALLDSPDYAARFASVYGGTPAQYRDILGIDLYAGPLGPITTRPVVSVRGDRTTNFVNVSQLRLVAGLRGDLPFINFGPVEDWTFDFYAMRTTSDGESARPGIRNDRLLNSLNTARFSVPGDPTSPIICGDGTDGCVPVNLWASSLYEGVVGDFATPEERAYVFDVRDFDTEVDQTLFSLYANGEIFSLPAGDVLFGIGAEYREDEIKSVPDDIARDGLFFGFFSDLGAAGEKWTKEFFAETEIPLLAGVPAFEELTVNVSSRHTEDEFYGSAWTYSGKLAWRPIDSLLLRGTTGTSYRAPNLRENFLLGTTGFNTLTDPCVIPDDARDELTGEYIPENDTREDQVFDNCLASGVDPRALDNNGFQSYSIELSRGGATDLQDEKSESWSAGFTWEEPFFSAFDLAIGATYYNIEIRGEIIDPTGQFIINDCYNDLQLDSPFCSRISRDDDGFIDFIDAGFINRDSTKADGVDVNMTIDWPTQVFGRAVDFQADFAFNRTLGVKEVFISDDGEASTDELAGEFTYPKWKGRMFFRADFGDWRATWSTRYISSVEQDAEGVDDFGNAPDGTADTCLGFDAGDINCRDVGFAENYFVHDMSLYYYGDVWTIGAGLRNVFNEAPPLVDSSEVFSFNNVPFGAGYDIMGRMLFLNLEYRWQ